jgi:hypothetical protein
MLLPRTAALTDKDAICLSLATQRDIEPAMRTNLPLSLEGAPLPLQAQTGLSFLMHVAWMRWKTALRQLQSKPGHASAMDPEVESLR